VGKLKALEIQPPDIRKGNKQYERTILNAPLAEVELPFYFVSSHNNGYYFAVWTNPRMDACSFSQTVADPCPVPLVGHRISVMRVLQTRVVTTQEKVCGVGIIKQKRNKIFIGQRGLSKSILVDLCST